MNKYRITLLIMALVIPLSAMSASTDAGVKIIQASQAIPKGINITNVSVVKTEQEAKALKAQWAAEGKMGTIIVAKDAKEAASAVSSIAGGLQGGDKSAAVAALVSAAVKAFPDAAPSIAAAAIEAVPSSVGAITQAAVKAGGNQQAIIQAATTALFEQQPPIIHASEGKSESNTNSISITQNVITTNLVNVISACGGDLDCQTKAAVAAVQATGANNSTLLSLLAAAIIAKVEAILPGDPNLDSIKNAVQQAAASPS